MKPGCCFEIADDLSARYCFAYVDTTDGLADLLFRHLKVDVEQEMVFHYDGDPFRIVMCHIPREQRDVFLRAVDLLPGLMAYAGKEGYDEYCEDLAEKARRYFAGQKEQAVLLQ